MVEPDIWQAEGRISFTSLLTDLFRTDQSYLEPDQFPFDDGDGLMTNMFWFTAQSGAAHGNDVPLQSNLPSGLGDKTRLKLHHERYHFAQLCTYPILQLNFLLEMELLRTAVAGRGGHKALLSGYSAFNQLMSEEQVRLGIEGLGVQMQGELMVRERLMGFEGIEDAKLIPMVFKQGERHYECSGGVLIFDDTHQFVPFTTINMLEGAAFVTEHLYGDEDPPRLDAPGSDADLRYKGMWEMWCRVRGGDYDTVKGAAEAFLIAVDLALAAHALVANDAEFAEKAKQKPFFDQARQPHVRFTMCLIQPGHVEVPDGLEGSERAWFIQNALCEGMGWPTPERSYAMMVAFLTRRFLLSSLWSFEEAVAFDEAVIAWVLTADLAEIANDLGRLDPVFETVSQSLQGPMDQGCPNSVIGTKLVARMIVAALVQIKKRISLATAHQDPGALSRHFDLPVVRLGNQYYIDDDLTSSPDMVAELGSITGLPLQLYDAGTDSVFLAAIAPLAKGEMRCGLIDPVLRQGNCMYVAAGGGCPQLGLSEAEAEQRAKMGVHDWCHWTHAVLRLGIAPDETVEAWRQRWGV